MVYIESVLMSETYTMNQHSHFGEKAQNQANSWAWEYTTYSFGSHLISSAVYSSSLLLNVM